MTEQGDPLTRRQAKAGRQGRSRRNKPAPGPDPDVRRAIVAAASESVRERGGWGLSVAAVLKDARLSTRAFYRHFESKDELVEAVFTEMTRAEVRRLKAKMATAATPVEAVAAWIDGRIDLAFNDGVAPELRQMPLAAPSTVFSSPELISPAYAAILEPLVEQLERGLEIGVFLGIVPAVAAKSIHGAVWAGTQQQWETGHAGRAEVRERAIQFCLRGLGVAPEVIEEIADEPPTA